MHVPKTMLLLTMTLALAACGQPGDDEADPTPTPDTLASVAGVWEVVDNTLFERFGLGELQLVELTADVHGDSGSGQLFGQHPTTGLHTCSDLVYVQTSEDLMLLSSQDLLFGSDLYFTNIGENTLQISDADGNTLEMVRGTSVPATSRCSDATVTAEFAVDTGLAQRSNLVFDGTQLWATSSASSMELLPVNLGTGTVGTPVTVGNSGVRFIQAFQDGDFWGLCGCSDGATTRGIGATPVDVVTFADLGLDFDPDAVATDGDVLYVAGYNRDIESPELLLIDANAEPDVLLDELPLDTTARGLLIDGSDLWVLTYTVNNTLYRLNTTTGQAEQTLRIPTNDFLRSVGADASSFYFKGDASHILEVQLP